MKKILMVLISFLLCYSVLAYAKKDTDAVFGPDRTASFKGNRSTYMIDTGVDLIDGDVWVWGYKLAGASGNGHNINHTDTAERVNYFVNNHIKIVDIAASAHSILALDEFGDVWGWGQNLYSAATGGVCTRSRLNYPCKVLSGKNVIQIGAGEYSSVALTADGYVYTWGYGLYGQAGNGTRKARNAVYRIPRSNFGGEKVVYIGDGYEAVFAITESGNVYGWGDNEDYSFGYQTSSSHEYVTRPKKLSFAHSNEIVQMCSTDFATIFLTKEGSVYGMGGAAQLGIGAKITTHGNKYSYPKFIIDNVKFLACRYAGSIVSVDDEILTWGSNLGTLYSMLYSSYPVSRPYNGNVCRIVPSKDRWFYWNTKGELYGVGYAGGLGAIEGGGRPQWPGVKMNAVMRSLKAVYGNGQEYIDKVCGY